MTNDHNGDGDERLVALPVRLVYEILVHLLSEGPAFYWPELFEAVHRVASPAERLRLEAERHWSVDETIPISESAAVVVAVWRAEAAAREERRVEWGAAAARRQAVRDSFAREALATLACPLCHQPPGQGCVTRPSGQLADQTHSARIGELAIALVACPSCPSGVGVACVGLANERTHVQRREQAAWHRFGEVVDKCSTGRLSEEGTPR